MGTGLDKDPVIIKVLEQLRSRLGPAAFVLADHWESDLCAVGIASPHNREVLVYLSCYGEPSDCFGYELELPRPQIDFVSNPDVVPYLVAGRGTGVRFEELVGIVAAHLRHAEPHSEKDEDNVCG